MWHLWLKDRQVWRSEDLNRDNRCKTTHMQVRWIWSNCSRASPSRLVNHHRHAEAGVIAPAGLHFQFCQWRTNNLPKSLFYRGWKKKSFCGDAEMIFLSGAENGPEDCEMTQIPLNSCLFSCFCQSSFDQSVRFCFRRPQEGEVFFARKNYFAGTFPTWTLPLKFNVFPPHLHQLCLCVSLHLAAKVFVFFGLWADG